MIANSVLPIPIPDGVYCGTWNGSRVSVSIDSVVTCFKVDKITKRHDFPCVIKVENKRATIDSGNPCKIPIFATTENKSAELRIGDNNICPITKNACDDECCPSGAICNLSGSTLNYGNDQ